MKIAPASKKSRTNDREETLRSGHDTAKEFAAAGNVPKDTAT